MGQLHELLAVEKELNAEAQRALGRVRALFKDGLERFLSKTRVYRPVTDDGEKFAPEITELSTTVQAELDIVKLSMIAWIDAAIQKELTNRYAKADLIIEETVVATLPATAFLNLENKLLEVRSLYASIPVIDPTVIWELDELGGYFRSTDRITYKTKKEPKSLVLYEATKEHPAQTEVYHEDTRVGEWTTTIYSGMTSPKEKREKLERIDNLIRAVKQARQRANTQEVESVHIAEQLLNHIEGAALS